MILVFVVLVILILIYGLGILVKMKRIDKKLEQVRLHFCDIPYTQEVTDKIDRLHSEITRMQKHPFRPW